MMKLLIPAFVPITFLLGLTTFMSLNGLARSLVNRFSILCFNIEGIAGRSIIVATYMIVGILSLLSTFIQINRSNSGANIVASIMLIVANLVWSSFGFIIYQGDDGSISLLIIRGTIIWLCGSVGLLVMGVNARIATSENTFSLITILAGSSMSVLFLAMAIVPLGSWLYLNLSLTVYFLWYGALAYYEARITRTSR